MPHSNLLMKCHLQSNTISVYFGFSWILDLLKQDTSEKVWLCKCLCVCVKNSLVDKTANGLGLKKYGHRRTQNISQGQLPLSLEARRVTKAGQLPPPPPQQTMIRREARAEHCPVLFVWFTTIWIAEAKKGH